MKTTTMTLLRGLFAFYLFVGIFGGLGAVTAESKREHSSSQPTLAQSTNEVPLQSCEMNLDASQNPDCAKKQ